MGDEKRIEDAHLTLLYQLLYDLNGTPADIFDEMKIINTKTLYAPAIDVSYTVTFNWTLTLANGDRKTWENSSTPETTTFSKVFPRSKSKDIMDAFIGGKDYDSKKLLEDLNNDRLVLTVEEARKNVEVKLKEVFNKQIEEYIKNTYYPETHNGWWLKYVNYKIINSANIAEETFVEFLITEYEYRGKRYFFISTKDRHFYCFTERPGFVPFEKNILLSTLKWAIYIYIPSLIISKYTGFRIEGVFFTLSMLALVYFGSKGSAKNNHIKNDLTNNIQYKHHDICDKLGLTKLYSSSNQKETQAEINQHTKNVKIFADAKELFVKKYEALGYKEKGYSPGRMCIMSDGVNCVKLLINIDTGDTGEYQCD